MYVYNNIFIIYIYRNEENQERLWEISVSAVKEHLSPETLHKYGTAQVAQSSSLRRARRHSFTPRRKPEDREKLIDSKDRTRDCRGVESDTEPSREEEEEEEEEERVIMQPSLCIPTYREY